MPITVCPHCEYPTDVVAGSLTYCSSCEKPFVCVDAYCTSKCDLQCKCWNYIANTAYVGNEIRIFPQSSFPLYLNSKKALSCTECGHSWGLNQAVIYQKGERVPRPFDGHFIVPLEEHYCLQVFHGTTSDCLVSIRANGIRPPQSAIEKRHGFNTEGNLRYVGRDLEPAKNHASTNCIIEVSYSGFIAITTLNCDGEALNLLFDNLPQEVGGVQYFENGRSVAFRKEADLRITKMPEESKRHESLVLKFWSWLRNAF